MTEKIQIVIKPRLSLSSVNVLKPLHVIAIALLLAGAAGLVSDTIGEIIGPIEYNGYLGYSFDGVDTTVHTVEWMFEEEIGESFIIIQAPSGWSHDVTSNSVILTGGTLAPGDDLEVKVSFRRYVESGEKPLSAVGLTSDGGALPAEGVLEVSNLILLRLLALLSQFSVPLLAGGVIVGGVGMFWPREPTDTVPGEPIEKTPPYIPTEEDEPTQEDEEEQSCSVGYRWMHQIMDLTVGPGSEEGLLYRALPDDPLPLRATGYDRHYLIHECTCPKTGSVSRESYLMFANVRYEWSIIRGKGGFIDKNDENLKKQDAGEQVIYMPPDIEDPTEKEEVTVMVTVYHDDATKPPDHDPVTAYLDMEITREIAEEGEGSKTDTEYTDPGELRDEYLYKLTLRKETQIGSQPPESAGGDCAPTKEWKVGGSIEGNIVHTPTDVAYGDYVRLKASGSDTDELSLICNPGGEGGCVKEDSVGVTVNDVLNYQWSADKGTFPRGGYGRECVWRAPDTPGPVNITLQISDKGDQFGDEPKTYRTKIIVQKLGIDLVKPPKSWLPDAANGAFKALATTYVCRDGKWTTPGRRKYVKAKLTKVSREPGVCLNYPKDGKNNPDLFFHEEQNRDRYLQYHDETDSADCPTEILVAGDNPAHQKHHLYAVSKKMENTAQPVIRVEDYGATGHLTASANHCVQIPPRDDASKKHEDCKEGSNTVKLPLDENGNDIADGAKQDLNGAPANQDNDAKPTGEGNGDGLTNYEEYRGFVVGGRRNVAMTVGPMVLNLPMGSAKQHTRTNVNKKDVFVYDADFLGTGMLDVTGLDIHILYLEDLFNGTDKREINFNHGRHHGGLQHGLWLRNQNMPGLYGRACGGANGPPKNKTHICINVAVNTAAGEPANRLANSIGHELCHGLNIWHHGEGGNHACGNASWNFTANSQGRLTSGNISCIMRYDQYAIAWCHDAHHTHMYATLTAQPDGTVNVVYNDPVGTMLCKDNAGTGLNNAGAGHINNATRGNCQGQLKVKDW